MKQIAIVLVALLTACSDRPAREKFPGPQGRTTDTQSAEMTQAMLGGFDPLNNPFVDSSQNQGSGGPGSANPWLGAAPGAGGPSLEGSISLGKNITVKPGMWLFVSVRPKDGGPPIAAKRERAPSFPYGFRLTQADAMMADTKFEGDVEVTARLDQDGDPLSRQRGDAVGSVSVTIPAKNLKIELNPISP